MESQSQTERKRTWSTTIGRWLLRVFFDPITIVSLWGPFLVSHSLRRAQLALLEVTRDPAAPSPWPEAHGMLGGGVFPGVLDYSLQFFVAFLGFVMLLAKAGRVGYVHVTKQELVDAPKDRRYLSPGAAVWGAVAFGFAVFGWLWCFWADGLSGLSILRTYIEANPKLGEMHIPPPRSMITWLRFAVFFMGATLSLLESGRFWRSAYSNQPNE